MFTDLDREIIRMFDCPAGHIADVQTAVWPGSDKDRTEPVVGTGEEFGFRMNARGDECASLTGQLIEVDQIPRGITGEDSAAIHFRQGITPIDIHATGRRESACV